MKKTIFIISLLVFGTYYKTNAQEPISFRSNALGGIVDDDLDLVYDPIELQFVDGIRLYTNLSNLTSNKEQLFENVSDDEFFDWYVIRESTIGFLVAFHFSTIPKFRNI